MKSGWLYILVRLYPFWAIPTGIFFIMAALRTKQSKWAKLIYFFLGMTMISLAILYFIYDGSNKAVPFLYKIINPDKID